MFSLLARLVCVLSQKKVLVPYLLFLPVLFCGDPLHNGRYFFSLLNQTVFDILSQPQQTMLFHFIWWGLGIQYFRSMCLPPLALAPYGPPTCFMQMTCA